MTRFRASVLLALAFATPSVARADEGAHRRAAESFRQAQAAFERRDFAAAAAAFEQAAEIEPHPAPVLDAADAWERAGDLVHAADDCDRALEMPTTVASYRKDAEQCVQRLAPRLGRLDLRGPGALAVRIDGGPRLLIPLRRRVTPGLHALLVVDLRSGTERRLEVDVRAGDLRTEDLTPAVAAPAPDAPASQPAPPMRTRGVPTSAWVPFGVAGGAVVVAGIFGVLTVNAKSDFDGGDHTQAAADTFHRDLVVTNVAWAIAGVAAATGAAIWIFAPKKSAPALGLGPARAGTGVALTLRLE